MTTPAGRPGRPAGGAGNRERILDAARDEFAAKGFRGATMRAIASRADVDVALLAHYFGGKDGLFAASMELPEKARSLFAVALAAPAPDRGALLTRHYLSLWEDPATGAQMRVLARSALTNESASVQLRGIITEMVAAGVADTPRAAALGLHQAGLTLAMSHLLGVAVARYLIQIPAVAELDLETVVARTAPAVQIHLDAADA